VLTRKNILKKLYSSCPVHNILGFWIKLNGNKNYK
ncbi:MAG: hypothetical protein ACJAZ3_000618, partial [Sphingobacteriales bacterium]